MSNPSGGCRKSCRVHVWWRDFWNRWTPPRLGKHRGRVVPRQRREEAGLSAGDDSPTVGTAAERVRKLTPAVAASGQEIYFSGVILGVGQARYTRITLGRLRDYVAVTANLKA